MDNGIKFDAVLTWSLPYDAKLIEWSLSRLVPKQKFCVMPFGIPARGPQLEMQNFIVEAPKSIWGAWQFKNDRVFAAISLPQQGGDHETDTLFQEALAGQKLRLALSDKPIVPVKVPSCCCVENSAVAAISNLNWLMSSKKRAHPGPLEYLRQRELDYNEYNKKDKKGADDKP